MAANERAKREYINKILSTINFENFVRFCFSSTDRNILSKILNDLERSDKTDNQRLEEKALEEFQ